MTLFSVRIEVGDASGERFETVDALVDTGATNTALPATLLRRLGILPHRRSNFDLADGRQVELDIGRAWVRVDGQQEFTQVVFGGDGTEPILGAVTLQEMGLRADPLGVLVPTARYL
jgi:clan AA aspartic protease